MTEPISGETQMRTVYVRDVKSGRELCFLLANSELARQFVSDFVDLSYKKPDKKLYKK